MMLSQRLRELAKKADHATTAALAAVDRGDTQAQIDRRRGEIASAHDRLAYEFMQHRQAILAALELAERVNDPAMVAWLEAIREVVREAHWALDDSEDLTSQDPPVHAVPHDNVVKLDEALTACETFAAPNEVWDGPGPLVTRIIDALKGNAK